MHVSQMMNLSKATLARIAALALAIAFPGTALAQYEIVQGYEDIAPKGPAAALGLIIWNHGVHGQHDTGAAPVPSYLRKAAQAGWDVIKIKRDGLQEGGGWTTAGLRHVARTVQEVEKAKQDGYKRIVLAGQSYGGAITLETSRRIDVYAIIPSAPGTGVGATELGSPMSNAQGSRQLYTALEEGKFERAIPILPLADEYATSSPERGRRAREILSARGVAFLPLDEASTQLVGHGASGSALMSFAYAACVAAFLAPATTRPAKLNRCGVDGLPPSPDTLKETADLKPMAMEAGTWWKPFEGVWVGAWHDPLLVSLTIEKGAAGPELVYLYGARNSEKLGRTYRAPAELVGSSIAAKLPHQQVTLTFDMTTRQIFLRWSNEGRSGSLRLRRYEPAG
jgi:dienelactone hydrolase